MIKRAWKQLTDREPHIESNMVIDDPESFAWTQKTDAVIAGFGGAGAATAIELRDQGVDTIVLERFQGGGATTISGGIFYSGGGTKTQAAAGVEDTPENMFNYLKQEVQGAVCDETLMRFCEQSAENHDWMIENGVKFDASFCPFKTSYPPNHYFFYYSGNESFAPFTNTATPAARGHRAHRPGISGAGIYEPLRDSALRKGIRFQPHSKVVSLITDKEGKVVGLKALQIKDSALARFAHKAVSKAQHLMRYCALFVPQVFPFFAMLAEKLEKKYATTSYIRANKGVVLATGGFFSNQKMVKEHAPDYAGGSPLGTVADDGSGIQMAQALGAKTELMDSVSAWRFINPPMEFVKGVMVGPKGTRVCNEMLYGAQVGSIMMKDHEGKAYVILDQSKYKQAYKDLSLKKGLWFHVLLGFFYLQFGIKKANSIPALANKLGINPTELSKTIDDYNAVARSDEADPMGKPKENVLPIEGGPYYAVNASYHYFFVPCTSLTLGGLKVNETSGAVQCTEGNDINGLYAVGRTAVGVPSKGYVSGLSIADCIFSGRRAANAIAAQE